MHAWEAHTRSETNERECTSTHPHKGEWTHTHTLIQTVTPGQSATMVWLPVKGKHEWLWPKKCSPDQSHMHLALHLYHVSALAFTGLEKFRSALKETQARTSRAAGGKRWMKNRLLFYGGAELSIFLEAYLADVSFTCIQFERTVKEPQSSWHKGEKRRQVKISLR